MALSARAGAAQQGMTSRLGFFKSSVEISPTPEKCQSVFYDTSRHTSAFQQLIIFALVIIHKTSVLGGACGYCGSVRFS